MTKDKLTQRRGVKRLLAVTLLSVAALQQAPAQTLKGFMLGTTGDPQTTARDAEHLTSEIGAKILRYPIYLAPQNGQPYVGEGDVEGYWVPRIWPIMQACQSHGATLLIEIHWPNDLSTPSGFGQGVIYDTKKFVDRWRALARRFYRQPNVWFGLGNEPRLAHGPNMNVPWYNVAQDAATAIRSVDQNRTIVLPITGSTSEVKSNFRPLLGVDGRIMRNQIVEAHFWNWGDALQLPGGTFPNGPKGWTRDGMRDALRPLRDLRDQYGTPILVGEVGFNAYSPYCASFLDNFTQVATNYGFNTIIHAYHEAPVWDYELNNPNAWNYLTGWVRS